MGPYLSTLRQAPPPAAAETPMDARQTLSADTLHQGLIPQGPAAKLQLVLDIAQHLARTLDVEVLLEKLVEQLMTLFPQADRALIILVEDDKLAVRAQRGRSGRDVTTLPFSRTIVLRALEE